MVEVDMHVHSCFSDGYDSPEEILEKAKRKGMKAVCLTDHDVFQGLAKFEKKAKELGIDTLTGIEITTRFAGTDVHILGYGIEYCDCCNTLNKKLVQQWKVRNLQAKEILEKYKQKGINITFEDIRRKVRCYGPAISPLYIRLYRSLLTDISFEETKKEIWIKGKYWSPINENLLISPKEAINLISSLNGISIFAHPGKFCNDAHSDMRKSLEKFFNLLESLQTIGLSGIEAYCPKHSVKQRNLFAGLAKEMGLVVTGGSDYHGFFDVEDNFGKVGISYEEFLQIKSVCFQ